MAFQNSLIKLLEGLRKPHKTVPENISEHIQRGISGRIDKVSHGCRLSSQGLQDYLTTYIAFKNTVAKSGLFKNTVVQDFFVSVAEQWRNRIPSPLWFEGFMKQFNESERNLFSHRYPVFYKAGQNTFAHDASAFENRINSLTNKD